ncbi:MAG: cyclase family protein [Nocardioidaceae bacterium]
MNRDDIVGYLREHRNWERWGPDDQLGALNLVTDTKRRRAAQLVRSGRAVSLGRPLPTTPAANNRTPAAHYTMRGLHPPGGGSATDFQGMAYHGQSATHIDALCHVWDADGMWGGRDPDDAVTFGGATWGSIDQWRNGVMTRGVLLDVPKFRAEPYVRDGAPVTGAELAAVAAQQRVELEPGDAVAVFCGRQAYEADNGPWSSDLARRPGLDASCLPFFREHDCAAILWDMWDALPDAYGLAFGVHAAIFAFGVAVVDSALLEPLSQACAEEGRSDFLLTVNPINVTGGTGSLVNPVAVF